MATRTVDYDFLAIASDHVHRQIHTATRGHVRLGQTVEVNMRKQRTIPYEIRMSHSIWHLQESRNKVAKYRCTHKDDRE